VVSRTHIDGFAAVRATVGARRDIASSRNRVCHDAPFRRGSSKAYLLGDELNAGSELALVKDEVLAVGAHQQREAADDHSLRTLLSATDTNVLSEEDRSEPEPQTANHLRVY
jgi:hypothetical protein